MEMNKKISKIYIFLPSLLKFVATVFVGTVLHDICFVNISDSFIPVILNNSFIPASI